MALKYLNFTGLSTLVSDIKTWVLARIPTKTSEITNDSGFLTSHQDLSNYVTLNGSQTVTGAKTFTGGVTLSNTAKMTVNHATVVKGTNPSSIQYWQIFNCDKNGGNWGTNTLSIIEGALDASGKSSIYFRACKNTANSTDNGTLAVVYDTANNKTWAECPTPDASSNDTKIATTAWVNSKGYLTSHQSLANYSTLANTIKSLSISGKTITYTKGDNTTGTLTTQDTVYTHPTTAGNKHIPSGGSANQYLKYSASGTAQWATIKTSELNNDSGFLTSHNPVDSALSTTSENAVQNKVVKGALDGKSDTGHTHTKSEITDFPTLATVATSGSYNDLSNKPTIPTVNNATLTIQKNGTTVKTFTANASSNVTANITVPTKTSDLTNDSHQTITVGTDTTSTASPAYSGTFTCIDSVTRDSNGHVTKVNTKTVTLPSDNNTDTKVTNTLGTTTKAYITGTTSATTNTGTQIFDTGVYLSTTAGELVASKFTGRLYGAVFFSGGNIDFADTTTTGVKENWWQSSTDKNGSAFSAYGMRRYHSTGANVTVLRTKNKNGKWADFCLELTDDDKFSATLSNVSSGVTVEGFRGNITGNAATATQFSANTTVALTGDATGTSDGSKKGWSVPVTLANSGVTAGTYGPSADVTGNNNATISVPEITVDAKGRVTSVVNRTLTCKNNTYSVYNKTLTIQKNGTNVATFTSNSNTDVTANITVPTKTSELTNNSGFLTSHQDLSLYPYKVSSFSNYGNGRWPYIDLGDTTTHPNGFNEIVATGKYQVRWTNATTVGVPFTTSAEVDGILEVDGTSSASGVSSYQRVVQRIYRCSAAHIVYFRYATYHDGAWNWSNWTSYGDIVTHNASEFLTSHQSLANYSTLVNTVKSISISGKTITVTPGSGSAYTLTTQDTVYTHPTTSGNKHIPSGGAVDQYLKYSASGTAVWADLIPIFSDEVFRWEHTVTVSAMNQSSEWEAVTEGYKYTASISLGRTRLSRIYLYLTTEENDLVKVVISNGYVFGAKNCVDSGKNSIKADTTTFGNVLTQTVTGSSRLNCLFCAYNTTVTLTITYTANAHVGGANPSLSGVITIRQ